NVSSMSGLTAVSSFELPILAGVQLAEYGVFRRDDTTGKYKNQNCEARDAGKLVTDLIERLGVRRIVVVGPGSTSRLLDESGLDLASCDEQIIESIEADPLLSWFWEAEKRTDQIAN